MADTRTCEQCDTSFVPGPARRDLDPGPAAAPAPARPGTWPQHLAAVLAASPGRPDNDHGDSAVEIAIYPDVIWLARILRAHRQPTAL